ncbi:hypothetical protein B9T35_09740 [Acinetobacter sp. ANC 3832]|nr:hypothetical protein B9T35_09740 [Acinetobacter sp. ANC 3832]
MSLKYLCNKAVLNTFARLKQFRGIATRYDKLKRNYEKRASTEALYFLERITLRNVDNLSYW